MWALAATVLFPFLLLGGRANGNLICWLPSSLALPPPPTHTPLLKLHLLLEKQGSVSVLSSWSPPRSPHLDHLYFPLLALSGMHAALSPASLSRMLTNTFIRPILCILRTPVGHTRRIMPLSPFISLHSQPQDAVLVWAHVSLAP